MTDQKKPTSEIGTHTKNNQSTANAFTEIRRPNANVAKEEKKKEEEPDSKAKKSK